MNKVLQREYQKLSLGFDQLSLREQLLILSCTVILVAFIGYFLLLDPVWQNNAKMAKNLERSQKDVLMMSQQSAELSKALALDPNASVKQRINDIQLQIDTVEQELAMQTANLVPASKMPQMLEQVLLSSANLKVVSLQSIAPFAISLSTEQAEPALYRHGVKLVIEGSYFDVQAYLEKLEALPWQFYWKRFDYKVTEYPLATVELEIYTLSTNKAFIGV